MADNSAKYLDAAADKPVRLTPVDWLLGVVMYGCTAALGALSPWARDAVYWIFGGNTGLAGTVLFFPLIATGLSLFSWQTPSVSGGPLSVQLASIVLYIAVTAICFGLGLHIGHRGAVGLLIHGIPAKGHLSVPSPWFQLVAVSCIAIYAQVWTAIRLIVYPRGADRLA